MRSAVRLTGGAETQRVGRGDQFEVLFRMHERVMGDQRGDVGQLGGFGAEKFAARRGVEEEIGDGDAWFRGAGRRRRRGGFCRRRFRCGCRARVFAGRGSKRDAGDGGDRRQRLAAKAERGNGEQIVGGAQLGGGVALEGEQRVVAIHAVAVVGDADELAAAGFDLDADAAGAGVERVFEQLLDDGGGTIHHLAGGDLVRHLVGKNANAPHEKSVSGMEEQEVGIRDSGLDSRINEKPGARGSWLSRIEIFLFSI